MDAPERVIINQNGTMIVTKFRPEWPSDVEYVRADIHREAIMQQLATAGRAQDALAELAMVRERAEKLALALRDIAQQKFYSMGIGVEPQPTREAHMARAALAEWEAGNGVCTDE